MFRPAFVFLCLAVLISPELARAQQSTGEHALQQRAVVLSMPHLLSYSSCLGFRLYPGDFPSDINLVMTAAHCVRDLKLNSVIVATSLDGKRSLGRYWFYWHDVDVAFLLIKPSLGWLAHVKNTRAYQTPPKGLPVLAMIRVGGGRPTVASGNVIGQRGYLISLLLPVANGTSGGGVVDLSGSPIGVVSTETPVYTHAASQASYTTNVVGMGIITRLLTQEHDRLLEKAYQLTSRH